MSNEIKTYSFTSFNEVDAEPIIKNASHGLNKEEAKAYINYLDFLAWKKKISGLTRLDALAIKNDVNRSDLRQLLLSETNTNNDEDLLKQLNRVYSWAIEVMECNIWLTIPKEDKGKIWKSVDAFIDFMYSTGIIKKKWWYLRVARCAILKTMSAFNQVFDNEELVALEEHARQFIEHIKNMEGVHNLVINWDEIVFDCCVVWEDGATRTIKKNKLTYRVKERIKILMKLITNRKYTHYDEMTDLIWLNIEVWWDQKDIEDLMIHFEKHSQHEWCEMDNKGAVSSDFNERSGIPKREKQKTEKPEETSDITPEDSPTRKVKRKEKATIADETLEGKTERLIERASTAEWYTNACLYMAAVTEKSVQIWKTPKIEMQFVPNNHKNNQGYRNHLVLDAKKIISFIARELWYCPAEHIKQVVMDVVGDLGVIGETEAEEQAKWIIRHLLKPEKWNTEGYLIRIQVDDGKWPMYTTRDIIQDEFYMKNYQKRYNTIVTYRPSEDDGRIENRVDSIYKAS